MFVSRIKRIYPFSRGITMALIRSVWRRRSPWKLFQVSSFFNQQHNQPMDATSGYTTGVTFADQVDKIVSSLKETADSGYTHATKIGTSVSNHVSDNKEAYIKGAAIAAASVATLSGLYYLRNNGFTRNYGKKKSKIIEKALRTLPLSDLNDIISMALEKSSLSRRQKRALTMTRNYKRCVENSLDVSDKFNAKRRQVILRFKVWLTDQEDDSQIDVDELTEQVARKELEEFGIDLDMDDGDIDDWLDGDDESSVEASRVSQSSSKPTVVPVPPKPEPPMNSIVSVGNFSFKVPESHVSFLNKDENRVELYKSCIKSTLNELGISDQAYQVPINRKKLFTKKLMARIPNHFWD